MAVAKNNITGDSIQSKIGNKSFDEGMDRIFGEKKKKDDEDYWANLTLETQARIDAANLAIKEAKDNAGVV